MGQRHQVYAILPYQFQQRKEEYYGNEKEEYVKGNVIALHHQWLYGTLPLRRLAQVLAFYEKGKDQNYHVFHKSGEYVGSPEEALQALYSLDLEEGTFQMAHVLPNSVAQDPGRADNNDGITIIDFRNEEQPKYAFMFLYEQEGQSELQPISGEAYVRSYYNQELYKGKGYSEEDQATYEAVIHRLTDVLKPYPVLTKEEVRAVFPKLFEKETNR